MSRRGVIRGIHFADVPPGQAKYVTCVRGAILDVVVDLRAGSPTFGQWVAVRLDERRRAVFLAEGLGHAFMALSDQATVLYLCSTPYAPGREHGVHPLDPEIGIDWPWRDGRRRRCCRTRTRRRRRCQSLAAGLLPDYADCLATPRAAQRPLAEGAPPLD